MIFYFIAAIFISSLISLFLSPITKNYFIRHGWIEDPQQKQSKTQNATALRPVPRGGGIPVYISVLITSLIFLPLDKHLFGILLASFTVLMIGVWDDIKDISPKLRLLTNILSALIVVGSGIGIAYISNPFGGVINLSTPQITFSLFGPHTIWILSDLLAILWIVWSMNIVGWANGVEGQLPGFVSISAIFIGILGLQYSSDITQWPVIILAGSVAGAYLGFLPFNFFPQQMMPGYSGKSLAGFFLAILAILSGAKLATVILLLGIPMIDATFVILRRLKQGKPIYLGDGQHLHHRLLKHGLTRPQIAICYWMFSFILGFISLYLNSQQKFYVFIGLILVFIGFTLQLSRNNSR